MTIFKSILLSISLMFASISAPLAANESAPMKQVKGTIDHILSTLKDDSISQQEKRQVIIDRISQSFDFTGMSQRALATNWKKANAEQKKDFIALFQQLIQNTYIGRLEAYTDEKVRYLKSKTKGRKAIIKTVIVTKTADIPIKYKLIHKGGNWLVYDVEIEKISLISNYRSTYQSLIKKNGFDGLLATMRDKVNELNP